ncbi:MAG: asparagine synthase-related protein [Methylohalobius sp. ZOD2]
MLLGQSAPRSPEKIPKSAEFLHVYKKKGQFLVQGTTACLFGQHNNESNTPAFPDGVYARWQWDNGEVRAINCRYGMYPLFYYATPDEFCISSSIVTLLQQGAPRDLDYTALSVFLRLGFFLGEDTAFQAIRQLPPNAVLRWRDGRISLTNSLAESQLQSLSREAAMDGYASLFRSAIQRRLPQDNEFVVPISGGRDSRHILFGLLETGRRPTFCMTARHFPPRPNPDLEVAKNLCATLSLHHVEPPPPPSRVQAELRKNEETHFCSEEHAWALAMADHLKGKTRVLYDGIAGDILSAGLYQSEEKLRLFDTDRQKLARFLLESRTAEIVLQRLLTPDFYRHVGPNVAIGRLMEELEKHVDSPNPIRSFYFWNRTRRAVALLPFGILSDFQVHTPYLDHDLYDFLTSLPPEIVLDHRFHTETLWKAYPRYRTLPFEQKKPGSVKDRAYFRRLSRELAGVAIRHGTSGIIRRSLILPRLAVCAMDGNSDWLWWGATRGLFLLQLEELTHKGNADKKEPH